jgi:hypothetical protein
MSTRARTRRGDAVLLILAALALAAVPLACSTGATPADDAALEGGPDGPEGDGRDAVLDAPADTDALDAGGVSLDAGDGTAGTDGRDAATDRGDGASPWAHEYLYTLAAQAFPGSGHPGVLVHIPPSFDPAGPLGVLVYVHGFNNCIVNAVEPTGSACTPGGPVRNAYDLIRQFDATGVQALLVLPEVAYDQATGNPGQLGTTNGLRNFLEELFSVALAPVIGVHHVADLGRVVLMSHSGGYTAVADMATTGGVPQVREIDLLDSLYGQTTLFDRFVMGHLAQFGDATVPLGGYRFADVYTSTGGTDANSVAMAQRVQTWLAATGDTARLLFDDTTATLTVADYQHPLIFKHSALAHDGVPRYYFSFLVAASGFPAR